MGRSKDKKIRTTRPVEAAVNRWCDMKEDALYVHNFLQDALRGN